MAASLIHQLSSLFTRQASISSSHRLHTQSCPLLFQATQSLWAEPMKKKRKTDPSILAARTQKKLKRIDKEIKRLTKFSRNLKPVAEIEGNRRKLMADVQRRRDPAVLTFEESESRALLHKHWSRYRSACHNEMVGSFSQAVSAQEEALEELRAESEDLYLAAIQKDDGNIPIKILGPKETPPFKEYATPDGDYVDTTRKY